MLDEKKTEDGSDVSEGERRYALELYMAAVILGHPTSQPWHEAHSQSHHVWYATCDMIFQSTMWEPPVKNSTAYCIVHDVNS